MERQEAERQEAERHQPLLVELQTEELPPKALAALGEAFAASIAAGLVAARLAPEGVGARAFATPRRLGVLIEQVATRAPDQPFRQKLLPVAIGLDRDGAPTAALSKRLAALGVEGVDGLVRESDGKQEFLVHVGVRAGVGLQQGLQQALDEAIAKAPIPKAMTYQLADGETTVSFARPAHRLVALHGETVVAVTALGIRAGRDTAGHRFLGRTPLAIHSAASYTSQLEAEGKVVPGFAERRDRIAALLRAAAERRNAVAVVPAALLDEVTALVEWPVVYESAFDAAFLDLPPECLILTMQQNQKYFALQDRDGRLLERFLLVSQLAAADGGAAIIAGNARVVRARLADARFFFDQDRKQPLADRLPLLARVVYHNRLGSQLARVERLTEIAVAIARMLEVDIATVERAARLAKADLRTEMVGEFPQLQGTMGRYYARHDGEATCVVEAIDQHYRPRFAGDALPESPVAICVALADKLEALVGLLGIGERPSGDKDPFALRRHALGTLRILVEKKLPLALDRLLSIAAHAFVAADRFTDPAADLLAFLHERLRGMMRDDGASAHEIEAIVSQQPLRVDLVPARLAAVRAFLQRPEAASLASANKRIGNILKKAQSELRAAAPFEMGLLRDPAEKSLAAAFAVAGPQSEACFQAGDYAGALLALVPLKAPVDRFFDEVMVMVDDEPLRNNRLALLAALRTRMNAVADISMLAAG
jgi:glycyl-tRNA synthetase beta chain